MFFWDAVVLIVLITTVGSVLQSRYKAKSGPVVEAADPEILRARDEVRQLKERIQVLERVITDNHGSHDLDREIERLRDR